MRHATRLLLLSAAMFTGSVVSAGGIPVSGRVLGPGGTPVAEADVELTPMLGAAGDRRALLDAKLAEPLAHGRTNTEGRFRVEAPGVGLWRVRVTAGGFVPVSTDLVPLIDAIELEDAELNVDTGMNIRVANEAGQPLGGATVLLSSDGMDRFFFNGSRWTLPPRFGVADGDGKLRLPRSDLEKISLSAWAAGHALVERRGVRGTTATLVLAEGIAAEIEVVSGSGTAVADVLVALGRGWHPVGFTDDEGRFVSRLDPGGSRELTLAAGDGRQLDTSMAVAPPEVPENGEAAPEENVPVVQRFELPSQIDIVGRLIDHDTRQAVGDGLVWVAELPDRAVVTDGKGRFELTAPGVGERRITAGAAGYLRAEGVSFQSGSGRPGPTIALRPAASIRGVVVDADGQPVVGAELELKAKPTGRFPDRRMFRWLNKGGARGVSDEDGTFRLAPVDPEVSWLVRADASGFAPSETPVDDLAPGRATDGVEIALTSGFTIEGSLVDRAGVGLANVEVELKPSLARDSSPISALTGDDPAHEAITGANGRFSVRDLPAGKFDLKTERAGFAPRRMSAIEIDEEVGRLDLGQITLEPGESLSGYVTGPDGQPVGEVEVRVGGGTTFFPAFGGGETEPQTVTDPSGWFRVDDLAAGQPVTLQFQRTGYVRKSLRAVEAPREEPLQVEIEPASEVRGTVVGEGGQPVAGAAVRVVRKRDFGLGRRGALEMPLGTDQSDDDGGFVIEGVSPGKAALVAEAPGYKKGRLDDLVLHVGEDLDALELKLDRGAAVQGQVKAPDGRPVIGARVRKVREEDSPFPLGSAMTDGDGQYRLDGLEPGEVSIEVRHDDYPRLVRDVEVRKGINRLDLSFEGGVDVHGSVFDASGNPVADASIELNPAGRSWGGPRGRSEGDGSFVITGVQDGDYELSAAAHGYARSSEQSVVVAGQSVEAIELRLVSGATLEGAIRGLAPEYLGRVSIRANPGSWRDSRSGVASYQGTYRIDNLLPGEYRVVATESASGRSARGSVTIEPETALATLDLEFEAGLVLSGHAVQGDEPIAGASVSARGIDVSSGSSTQTDPDGAFELEGLEAGRYQVSLRDWQTGLSHEEAIDVAASREIVLRVPTAVIAGEIVDGSDSGPLAGVAVFAERDTEAGGRPVAVNETTGSDGSFEVANLADGEWRLTANKKGYAAHTQTVLVSGGQDVRNLEIAMNPTEGLTLEVRLPSGAVPDQLYAAVLDGSGTALVSGSYATGEGGRVRLSSVPPGTWELLVNAAGSATSAYSVSSPGPPLTIGLEPASRLNIHLPDLADSGTAATVRLQDADGQPFRAIGWSGQARSEWRVTTGRLSLESLPPSSWTVTATTAEGRSWQGQATTSAGGTVDLVLE